MEEEEPKTLGELLDGAAAEEPDGELLDNARDLVRARRPEIGRLNSANYIIN